MKLSIPLSALLTAGTVSARREGGQRRGLLRYVAYPAGCIVRPGVRALRPPAESRDPA